uniref:Variant surface glycoprotein 1800 n=1 Tax=Trypanosoma brucei TaxID=5691 RepID=M4SXC4_9TRYP|nr:variant surface glycoprotein 1800 [Trypanosoma brucei]
MENQQYKRAVAPTLAILLVITVAATCQRKADPAATAISNACDEEYYLQKLKHHVSSLLDGTEQTIVEQRSKLRKIRLAQAAATEHEHRCLLHGLAAAFGEALEANTRTVHNNEGMIQTALKHISRQQQTAAAAIALSKINTKVTTGRVHTGGSTTTNKVTIKLTTDGSLTGGCSVTGKDQTRQIGAAQPDVANVHSIKLTTADKLYKAAGQTEFSVTARGSCSNGASQERRQRSAAVRSSGGPLRLKQRSLDRSTKIRRQQYSTATPAQKAAATRRWHRRTTTACRKSI